MRTAFTLAEVLVTLTILGIVASITVPGIMQRQTERTNKTKIKKALASYEAVINKIVVANNHIRSVDSLNEFGKNNANCSNAMSYFKATEQEGCVFRTSDGLWWDIGTNGTMAKTIVSFKKEDLTVENALNEGSNKAFYFVTDFENDGVMRIEDINYGWSKGNVSHSISSSKVYGFINGENYYKFCEGNNNKSCMKKTGGSEDCKATYQNGAIYDTSCTFQLFDENGKLIVQRNYCNKDGYCSETQKRKDYPVEGGSEAELMLNCDNQGENCKQKQYIFYHDEYNNFESIPEWGNVYDYKESWTGCDINDTDKSTCTKHQTTYIYKNSETGAITQIYNQDDTWTRVFGDAYNGGYYYGCDRQGKNCTSSYLRETTGESTLAYKCNEPEKNNCTCSDSNLNDDVKCP